jgi:hypothetical protein
MSTANETPSLDELSAVPGLIKHGDRLKLQVYLTRDIAAALVEEMNATGEAAGSCARRIITSSLRSASRKPISNQWVEESETLIEELSTPRQD